jgi:hypothetical protein
MHRIAPVLACYTECLSLGHFKPSYQAAPTIDLEGDYNDGAVFRGANRIANLKVF